MSTQRTIVIGGAAGMWGDSYLATPQLLADGRCRYLIYEALAEITMAVLTKAREKDPEQGYARDVMTTIGTHVGAMRERGVRVVTNAGGINPKAAAAALRAIARKAGYELSIATIEGDDLLDQLDDLRTLGITELSRGTAIPQAPLSFNAYLGARPIAAALAAGADVVITGRCVDSALVLGPLIHEFGWAVSDYDALSQGSLAGHLLECGPQSIGGLLTDWEATRSWARSGYPITEVGADGSFVLTTSAQSDGLVDRRTVGEQLVYEIGDPAAYLLPDVICDWTAVQLEEIGPNRVRVSGARGVAPTGTLKACAQAPDGFRVQIMFFLGSRDAVAKGRRLAANLLERGRNLLAARGFAPLRAHLIELIGAEDTYGPHARMQANREIMVRLALHHDQADALQAFVREFPSFGLSGPPGMGGGGALPRPSPVLRLHSFLVPVDLPKVRVEIDGELVALPDSATTVTVPDRVPRGADAPVPTLTDEDCDEVPLVEIAYGRSGDKGNDVNIGIIARNAEVEPIIQAQVTADRVTRHLAHLEALRVDRFAIPGIHGINLVLRDGLGGGGTTSLRMDPQGKAVAQQLLDMPVRVPRRLLERLRAATFVPLA